MEYIDINTLVDRIKRNTLMDDIPYETIVDYALEFIKITGVPANFIEKTAKVEIKDYKGLLPCDFYKIIQVRDKKGYCFRASTDSFHMSPDKEKNDHNKRETGFTYKIQGSCIITSMPEGELEIAYRSFPVNEEGLPLIPDNGSYPRALQEYITVEWYTMLCDQGKISPQVLQNRQQRYAWYVGQAQADLVMPTIDEMQSITNSWNKLLEGRGHSNGFVMEGAKQIIRRH